MSAAFLFKGCLIFTSALFHRTRLGKSWTRSEHIYREKSDLIGLSIYSDTLAISALNPCSANQSNPSDAVSKWRVDPFCFCRSIIRSS